MKKLGRRLCLLWLIIISFCFSAKSQNDIYECIELAEKYESVDNIAAQNKMLLKAYFLDREGSFTYLPKYISESFYALEDYDNALKFLNIYAKQKVLNEEEQIVAKYAKVGMLLRQKSYKKCQSTLFQFKSNEIEYEPDKYHYYLSMCYLFDKNYLKAKNQINSLSYAHNIDQATLTKIFKKLDKNLGRKHRLYTVMSMAIPGLGQLASGDYSDALNSFLLNAGFVGLFFYVEETLGLTDAVLSVAPWFYRYYIGGINNASITSQARQKELTERYILELNQLIINTKDNI